MKMITIWYFYTALKKQTEKFDHVESSEPSNSLILKLQKPVRVPWGIQHFIFSQLNFFLHKFSILLTHIASKTSSQTLFSFYFLSVLFAYFVFSSGCGPPPKTVATARRGRIRWKNYVAKKSFSFRKVLPYFSRDNGASFWVSINDFECVPSCRRWQYPVIRLLINREAVRTSSSPEL